MTPLELAEQAVTAAARHYRVEPTLERYLTLEYLVQEMVRECGGVWRNGHWVAP